MTQPQTPSQDPNDHEDEPSGRGALIALAVLALLVLGGLFLMRVLGGAAATQDCLAAGRTNCAPIKSGP